MRAFVTASASRSVALLLIATAAVALLGWVLDVAWLMQPFDAFPPLRVMPALGLLFVGAGLYASPFPSRQRIAQVCGVIAIVLGTIALQHAQGIDWLWTALAQIPSPAHANWHGEMPGQVALSSAVFVTLGGVGLLAIVSRRRGLWSSIILSASGGIVMLLATTVIVGQLMGFLDGLEYGPLLGSSLQSTVCAIVFATHFNALVWTKEAGFSPPPAWLPLSVGAGSLVTVLLLWRALLLSEDRLLSQQTRVAARATRSAVIRQLMVAQRSLQRQARYSQAPDARWSAVSAQIVDDIGGLEAMVWTDREGQRLAANNGARGGMLDTIDVTVRPLAPQIRADITGKARFIPLHGDPSRALMVIPRCVATDCSAIFVALVDSRTLLGTVLADTVLGFEMAIGKQGAWFRASAPAAAAGGLHHLVREAVIRGGPEWELGVWPSARTAAVTPSSLSDFVLLLGIAVSVLLAIALRLAQSVSETARREERAALDRALQSTTDGLWEWDLLSGVVTRSPQLWVRLGYGSGAALRRMSDWLALIHPQDRPGVEARIADHLAGRVDAFDAQYRVKSAAGRWHDFLDRGRVVLYSPEGTPMRLLGMFADVTDRRHAEESLRQAETMSTMGRLAARIAHEINNPLAGIQSAFLLIKDAIPATHPHVKYVGAIEREVERISQVTRQLYETYRPETESSSNAPVQTVVGDAVAFLEQVNRNTGVSIEVEMGGIAAVVRLPNTILRQCVYNLVQNAIEASPRGSTVSVQGWIDGPDFVLRVSDMGPGVPSELREEIFDPFVSTKPSQLSTGGMGLGLSLVRRALDAAGGSINVADAAGGGAEFIARIPLAETSVPGVTA